MGTYRLIQIHSVQARGVKTRQPHIADDHDPERLLRILKKPCHFLAAGLIADVRLPIGRVRRRTGHHDLNGSLTIVLVMPVGTNRCNSLVKLYADTTAHADDHRLPVHRRKSCLEVPY